MALARHSWRSPLPKQTILRLGGTMRNTGLYLFAAVMWALTAQAPMLGQSPSQAPTPNPNAIALLRWYSANTVTQFDTGLKQLGGIAYDGQNMWVVGIGSNAVSKIRENDCTLLGTFSVGEAPYGAAFDGANIWVTNSNNKTVSKLRASDGATLGTFTVG